VTTRWFALIAVLFAVALAISGFLYTRSRSTDLDAHARAVGTIGEVRHLDRQLSAQVLEARFGLLNHYDPLNVTQAELGRDAAALRGRLAAVVAVDVELERSITEFTHAVEARTEAVERFKGENSILKNSLRYLPIAADEVEQALSQPGPETETLRRAIHDLVRAALVYNLIGDQSTRETHLRALGRLSETAPGLAPGLASELEPLLAHARVVAERQPSVDGWVRRASSDDLDARLTDVERLYDRRFGAAAANANGYRRILYVWSLCLVGLVALAGLALRRLYADLERRVTERTRELARALDALWGEMRLARKIQEALVPAAPELDHCEVAVTMKAAEEVGGDYYDVLRAGRHEWILIGDVSGHGVPAGLVMMMCQTAVRTALERDPDLTPDRLLSVVNAVLTDNIRRLGEDKYMTMTALRRDPEGTITFAGAHQDIFVYRAARDEVETIETSGLWLGLMAAPEGAFTSRTFAFAPGDVLVVYTDGITEAVANGTLFDTAGVQQVLGEAKGKTAAEIRDGVLGALATFELRDDATLLVIKNLGDTLTAGRAAPTEVARPVA